MPTVVDAAVLAGSAAGWTPSHIERVAFEYRRFVELATLRPRDALVPAHDVDVVWHECLELGVDGTPRHAVATSSPASMGGANSAAALTRALYRECFGAPPPPMWMTSAGCQVDAPDGDEPPPAE